MKCGKCSNDARYVNTLGEYLCGVCDVLSPWASILLTNVPALLRAAEKFIRGDFSQLLKDSTREIICRKR